MACVIRSLWAMALKVFVAERALVLVLYFFKFAIVDIFSFQKTRSCCYLINRPKLFFGDLDTLNDSSSSLAQVQNFLLPRLMTGEVRV